MKNRPITSVSGSNTLAVAAVGPVVQQRQFRELIPTLLSISTVPAAITIHPLAADLAYLDATPLLVNYAVKATSFPFLSIGDDMPTHAYRIVGTRRGQTYDWEGVTSGIGFSPISGVLGTVIGSIFPFTGQTGLVLAKLYDAMVTTNESANCVIVIDQHRENISIFKFANSLFVTGANGMDSYLSGDGDSYATFTLSGIGGATPQWAE